MSLSQGNYSDSSSEDENMPPRAESTQEKPAQSAQSIIVGRRPTPEKEKGVQKKKKKRDEESVDSLSEEDQEMSLSIRKGAAQSEKIRSKGAQEKKIRSGAAQGEQDKRIRSGAAAEEREEEEEESVGSSASRAEGSRKKMTPEMQYSSLNMDMCSCEMVFDLMNGCVGRSNDARVPSVVGNKVMSVHLEAQGIIALRNAFHVASALQSTNAIPLIFVRVDASGNPITDTEHLRRYPGGRGRIIIGYTDNVVAVKAPISCRIHVYDIEAFQDHLQYRNGAINIQLGSMNPGNSSDTIGFVPVTHRDAFRPPLQLPLATSKLRLVVMSNSRSTFDPYMVELQWYSKDEIIAISSTIASRPSSSSSPAGAADAMSSHSYSSTLREVKLGIPNTPIGCKASFSIQFVMDACTESRVTSKKMKMEDGEDDNLVAADEENRQEMDEQEWQDVFGKGTKEYVILDVTTLKSIVDDAVKQKADNLSWKVFQPDPSNVESTEAFAKNASIRYIYNKTKERLSNQPRSLSIEWTNDETRSRCKVTVPCCLMPCNGEEPTQSFDYVIKTKTLSKLLKHLNGKMYIYLCEMSHGASTLLIYVLSANEDNKMSAKKPKMNRKNNKKKRGRDDDDDDDADEASSTTAEVSDPVRIPHPLERELDEYVVIAMATIVNDQ